MKLKKSEIVLLSLALAALFFTAGFFTGRSSGDVKVTIQHDSSDRTLPPAEDPVEGEKVNINTSTEKGLMTLPGIGEVLAERIVSYRNDNGAFLCCEELLNVPGIGEALFDAIEPFITI